MATLVTAFRISRTSQALTGIHLCHFALVGRASHDYYWNSVTLGLASLKQSHVPSQMNVLRLCIAAETKWSLRMTVPFSMLELLSMSRLYQRKIKLLRHQLSRLQLIVGQLDRLRV